MDAKKLVELLEALKLNPEQRAQLQDALRLVGSAGADPGKRSDSKTSVPPDAREAPRTRVQMRIHVAAGDSLAGDSKLPTTGAPGFEEDLKRLSPQMRAKLRAFEPQLLRWLDKSKENALLFTTDPIAALRKAAPSLDEETLSALAALRGTGATFQPDLPGVEFTSITIDAKGKPRGRDRNVAHKPSKKSKK
jgi:hypothetical protein